MKTTILIFAIISVFAFTSCEDDSNNTNVGTPTDVTNTVQTGDWKITYFYDSDKEETSNYTSYKFTFSDDGILTANNGSSTVTGTWSTGNDDSTVKMIISFASPDMFEELSDDWHVIERTSTKIRLEDVSGGDGGTDYLTFEKN
jgi:hypothetical protein